jgi:ATP-dependent DNA helicase RecG
MSVRFLGPDPIEVELNWVLDALAQGRAPRDIERRLVDCKEEPGRRGADGRSGPALPRMSGRRRFASPAPGARSEPA